MEQQPEFVGTAVALSIPRHFVVSFQALSTVNEVNIVCSTAVASLDQSQQIGMSLTPEVQVTMTWVAAKELAILLASQVAQYEKDNGVLTSDFLKANSVG